MSRRTHDKRHERGRESCSSQWSPPAANLLCLLACEELTQADKLRQTREHNPLCTIRRQSSTGEWVVNLKRERGGTRETAYHTKDLNCAIETMHALNVFYSER